VHLNGDTAMHMRIELIGFGREWSRERPPTRNPQQSHFCIAVAREQGRTLPSATGVTAGSAAAESSSTSSPALSRSDMKLSTLSSATTFKGGFNPRGFSRVSIFTRVEVFTHPCRRHRPRRSHWPPPPQPPAVPPPPPPPEQPAQPAQPPPPAAPPCAAPAPRALGTPRTPSP
jgi:hypothetical protein